MGGSGGMPQVTEWLYIFWLNFYGTLVIYDLCCPISSFILVSNEWCLRRWWLLKSRQDFGRQFGSIGRQVGPTQYKINPVYAPDLHNDAYD